jgi:hypothetical protein
MTLQAFGASPPALRIPAMHNGRFQMHGGKAGHKPAHGNNTKAAIARRACARMVLRKLRALLR